MYIGSNMTKKKKIALLNMRYDNNYGGNLQRFALVTVLQRMGYEVEYLYIRDNWDSWFTTRSWKKIIIRCIKQFIKFIFHPLNEPLIAWHKEDDTYVKQCKITEPFLDKYIIHTKVLYTSNDLKRIIKNKQYDAIVAGSDQIWRKKYIERYGIGLFFMDFLPKTFTGKKIIYGASFGVDYREYSEKEMSYIRSFYSSLDYVSVREVSALSLLNQYGLINPKAEIVLDPTLLLEKEDYISLIKSTKTVAPEGNMFCYILDKTYEIEQLITQISGEKQLKPLIWSLETEGTIEQWLRSFLEAEYIVTDSYHGLLFSIIFNKPFRLIKNELRGQTRFDSIYQLLDIKLAKDDFNWDVITKKISKLRKKSMSVLTIL